MNAAGPVLLVEAFGMKANLRPTIETRLVCLSFCSQIRKTTWICKIYLFESPLILASFWRLLKNKTFLISHFLYEKQSFV